MQLMFVLLSVFIATVGVALPFPLLSPMFLGEQVSVFNDVNLDPELMLALALASYPAGMLLGSCVIGGLADAYGKVKILTITMLLSAIFYAASGLSISQGFFYIFVISRFVSGVFEGNIAIASALALELGGEDNQANAQSKLNSATFLGWLVGPILGGVLATYSFALVFYAVAGVLVLSAVLLFFRVQEQTVCAQKDNRQKSFVSLFVEANSLGLLKYQTILKMLSVYFVIAFGLNAFYQFYPAWLVDKFDSNTVDISIYTTIMAVSMSLFSFFLMSLVQKYISFRVGLVLACLSLSLLIALLPVISAWGIYVIFALLGTFIAIFSGLFPVLFCQTCESEASGKGTAMGLLVFAYTLSSIVVALVGGYILKVESNYLLWVSASAILLGKFLLARTLVSEQIPVLEKS
ncbi:MFS transporter [Pseudoalteromonas viridis]|uniref:MFS transporter n=1 Tax=Pseudoalteromonas viridis TaxID=339617 RepID=A0ABX7VDJ5_9GAMM|nr:MFS transporter [Pseudoalteromonas viridis]QTL36664.1 MFS transporter [Pseudoalteromonas viridis]